MFSPTDEEVSHARRVVEALDAALQRGDGAVALDGRMVDAPVAARARQVLLRRAAIDRRTAMAAAATAGTPSP